MTVHHADIKWTSAASYSSPDLTMFVGESLHPGGVALTRQLLEYGDCRANTVLLDAASGRGASTVMAAQHFGADAVGVDLSEFNVTLSYEAAAKANLLNPPGFMMADLEELPFPDESYEVVLAECALGAIPQKDVALQEFFRVLEPGGRLIVLDLGVQTERLPEALQGTYGLISTVSSAWPMGDYLTTCQLIGFDIFMLSNRSRILAKEVQEVRNRVTALGNQCSLPAGTDFHQVQGSLAAFSECIDSGVIDYGFFIACKPS